MLCSYYVQGLLFVVVCQEEVVVVPGGIFSAQASLSFLAAASLEGGVLLLRKYQVSQQVLIMDRHLTFSKFNHLTNLLS